MKPFLEFELNIGRTHPFAVFIWAPEGPLAPWAVTPPVCPPPSEEPPSWARRMADVPHVPRITGRESVA